MDLTISAQERALQEKARAFCEEYLFPVEVDCELNDGLSEDTHATIKKAVVAWGLNAINHEKEHGGQGHTVFQQNLINEELGRTTGGLWHLVWEPGLPLRLGTPEQIRDYLIPSCLGERRVCFALTEPGAGSDLARIQTKAVRRGGKLRLTGEKWHVTAANVCDYMMVLALYEGDPDKPTLFFVEKDLPGVRVLGTPKYMHTYVFEHLRMGFEDVEVDESRILGGRAGIGRGIDQVKEWFVETRLQIGSHCVGAATRATEIAHEFAAGRDAFGRRLVDHQGVSFPLADMAVDIMAAKSLLYRVCWEVSQGMDPRLMNARASAVKLYCSEMAARVLDSAVQILGGRGYMRENPVERLYRDMRVHRIWEGTSEIQRVIIGNQINKRGLGIYTDWN